MHETFTRRGIARISFAAFAMLAANSSLAQTWEAVPPFAPNPSGREHLIGLALPGQIVALGGTPWANENDMDGSVQTLDLGDAMWVERLPLGGEGPIVRQGAAVDALGRIVVFGGVDEFDDGHTVGDPYVYDFVEGAWFNTGPRGVAAPNDNIAFCADADGLIYSLGGGPGENADLGDPNSVYAERYDANTDQWSALAPMPSPVAAGAAVDDGRGHVLVIGGVTQFGEARTTNVAQYDIATNAWSDEAIMDAPVAISGARAVLGADGRVYVLGGEAGPIGVGVIQSSCWILDLDMNQWIVGPAMSEARINFGAVLADDDFIYVLGGTTPSGGTSACERLYTPPCPVFVAQPATKSLWAGQKAVLRVITTGASPMTYEWFKDGAPLSDGPTGSGSVISGVTTDALVISNISAADDGEYTCIATNACGMTESDLGALTVQTPPSLPTRFTVVPLHPGGALASGADTIAGGKPFGSITVYFPELNINVSHPVRWSGAAASIQDLTPPGSAGGAVLDAKGDVAAGWWWWPYTCFIGGQAQTCYTRQAAAWFGPTLTFDNLQVSGWEYSMASGTDGAYVAGTATTDDAVGNISSLGVRWSPPNYSWQSVQPSGFLAHVSVTAVDDGRLYGTVSTHASMWTGPGTSAIDIHPAGHTRSFVRDAGDGQQVGAAYLVDTPRAGIWDEDALSFTDLTPDGALSSDVFSCSDGLQVGTAGFEGIGSRPVLWASSPEQFIELSQFLPADYTGGTARDVEVQPDGSIWIVGSAYNSVTMRSEAVLWMSVACAADLNGDGDVNGADLASLLSAWGPCAGN